MTDGAIPKSIKKRNLNDLRTPITRINEFFISIEFAKNICYAIYVCAEKWKAQGGTLTIGVCDMANMATARRAFLLCNDPRFELLRGIKRKLFFPHEQVIIISHFGCPIALAHPEGLKTDFNFDVGQVQFCRENFPDVKEFLLVGHECGYYKNISPNPVHIEVKKADIVRGAIFLMEKFSDIVASAYFAADVHGNGKDLAIEKLQIAVCARH